MQGSIKDGNIGSGLQSWRFFFALFYLQAFFWWAPFQSR